MPKDFGQRLAFDPRMAQEISRDPRMSAEQPADFLGEWGGSSGYQYQARQPQIERMTYYAIEEGYSTEADLKSVLGEYGVPPAEVTRALTSLERKGRIAAGQVAK